MVTGGSCCGGGVIAGGGAALPGVPRRNQGHGETPLDSPKPMVGLARRLASACDAVARGKVTGHRRDAVVEGAVDFLHIKIDQGVRDTREVKGRRKGKKRVAGKVYGGRNARRTVAVPCDSGEGFSRPGGAIGREERGERERGSRAL